MRMWSIVRRMYVRIKIACKCPRQTQMRFTCCRLMFGWNLTQWATQGMGVDRHANRKEPCVGVGTNVTRKYSASLGPYGTSDLDE